MSYTLFAIAAALAPGALRAAGDFLKENKGVLKSATPVIHDTSKIIDQKVDEFKNMHKKDGWEEE